MAGTIPMKEAKELLAMNDIIDLLYHQQAAARFTGFPILSTAQKMQLIDILTPTQVKMLAGHVIGMIRASEFRVAKQEKERKSAYDYD